MTSSSPSPKQPRPPVLCLVHGAYTGPAFYAPLAERLRARGFDVLTPRNPTLGADAAARRNADDARALQALAAPYFAEGRDVVLLAHSFGGVTAAHAAAGHTVAERAAADEPAGFRGLVFYGAFIIPQGLSFTGMLGDKPADFIEHGPLGKGDQICSLKPGMKPIFYSDIEPAEAQRLYEMNEPMAQNVMEEPITVDVAALPLAKHYVVLGDDLAVPTPLQEKMAAGVPGMKVTRMPGGHSPYFTQPDKLADIVCEAVKEMMEN